MSDEIKVTPEQIEEAVVRVLSRVLDRIEDDIRADTGRYAAFHWDDGFTECRLCDIDWATLSIEAEFETEDWVYGRDDFDLSKSLFGDERFSEDETTDTGLKKLFGSQAGMLYGAQFAKLIKQERLAMEQLAWTTVYGRIRGGESLVEAATSLFLLNDFENLHMVSGEYAGVDEDWVEFINGIEPVPLRGHIGMFFQEPQSARCCGAALDGVPNDGALIEKDGKPCFEIVASWWIGEGQGNCYLAKIIDDSIPDLPEFAGRALLTREQPEVPERSRPPVSGHSDEITGKPLREHLVVTENENYLAFLEAAGDRKLESFIAGMSIAQENLWKIMIPIRSLRREGNAHAELALMHAAREVMTPDERERTQLRWAQTLHHLECHEEAVEAFSTCIETGELCSEDFMLHMGHVHEGYARAALDAGNPALAVEQADQSLAVDEGRDGAIAIKGIALFQQGQQDSGFELLEKVMQHGIDPDPPQNLAEHVRYRELALKYSIAVPLFN